MTFEYSSIYYDSAAVRGRVIDIFSPDRPAEVGVFFVHGGGWNGGHREIFHTLMRALVEKGFMCASCDYRTGCGVTALDQLFDVRCGYGIFADRLARRASTGKIVVHGSSAGAHLALLLSMAAPGEAGECLGGFGDLTVDPAKWTKPAGVVASCAPVTFEPWDEIFPPIWDAMVRAAGKTFEQDPALYKRLSPISYVREDSPPVLLMHAANEHMFPLEIANRFVDAMHRCKAPVDLRIYPAAEHGFFYALSRRCQQQAFADFVEFLAQTSGRA
jgi:acetyl esterase/lipase